ncbi:organic cation transporter protein-like [Ruditapes philippinarum]|uniref:organic cation transporter protein-like n=1 Tax=Ruditapes philippinarum TaxID=129788 RepID=UPI00295C3698|nr:organic cation transporter protein-like [Ruditapes philippinarum]
MTSPYISDMGKYVHGSFGEVLPQIMFGACSVIAGMTSLLLPETNGKPLPETVFDAVQFGKKKADDRNSRFTVFYTNDAFNKDELSGEV